MLKAEKGFTLIELLVVIAIIGILAVSLLAFLGPARQKARDAKRKDALNALQKALELYYNDNNVYPSALSDLVPKYIAEVPKDPKTNSSSDYSYLREDDAGVSGDQGYRVDASAFENTSDPALVSGTYRVCGGVRVKTDCVK